MSTLAHYIDDRLAELDISKVYTYEALGTKKRFTRIINRPERATLPDLLRLAHRLEVHPLYLTEKYGFATLMITQYDKLQLRIHYRVVDQDSPANTDNATPTPLFTPSAPTPTVTVAQPAGCTGDRTGSPACPSESCAPCLP